MSDGTVLSEEQLRDAYNEGQRAEWARAVTTKEDMLSPGSRGIVAGLRAVERAVLEEVHPQCTDPIVGEHGHPLCGEVERLRARVAELELENTKWQDGHLARTVERDAARRELEEAREDTARLDWLGAPDDVGGRWARVWRTWNGEEPLRVALDRAREGE